MIIIPITITITLANITPVGFLLGCALIGLQWISRRKQAI